MKILPFAKVVCEKSRNLLSQANQAFNESRRAEQDMNEMLSQRSATPEPLSLSPIDALRGVYNTVRYVALEEVIGDIKDAFSSSKTKD